MLYLGYPGDWCRFWENDHILGIYRLYLGYPGNWYWFWENNHVLGIYKLYLGYPGTFDLCKFLMWGGRVRKRNECSSRQHRQPVKPIKTVKSIKPIKPVISRFTNIPQQVHYVVLPPCFNLLCVSGNSKRKIIFWKSNFPKVWFLHYENRQKL